MQDFPHRIDTDSENAIEWVQTHQSQIEDNLKSEGAVLIRGLPITTVADFDEVSQVLTPEALDYVGGGSPRTKLQNRVYTSTEYPSQLHIPLHIEASYMPAIPKRLLFCCITPCQDRGETPIGDMRQVLSALPDELIQKFQDKKITYITNMHGGQSFGKSWMQVFETEDKHKIESFLDENHYQYEWTANNQLRTLITQDATGEHHVDGTPYWITQAINWHPSEFDAQTRAQIKKLYGEEINFPKSVSYGDGSLIDDEDIAVIRETLLAHEKKFTWHQGDLLLVDNHWIAHGREPFSGDRKILVSMC